MNMSISSSASNHSKWYVVLTKPKQEKRAEEHLQAQGAEAFLPRIALEKMHKGKRVEKVEVLFPGYLFVNVQGCESIIGSIRSTRGVRQLLRFAMEPLQVNTWLIEDLRNRCYQQLENQLGDNQKSRQNLYKTGQKVEVTSGPFKDYQAIFDQFDGEARAFVLLDILNQQQELLVELKQLQATE